MTTPTRRQLIGLGLTAGTSALLTPAGYADDKASTANDTVIDGLGTDDGLRFRVQSGYRPDLSADAQRRLTRATMDFLLDAHPPGMTLALWDDNPRDLPYLEEHISATVGAVFSGVEQQLPTQPVDPVLIVSLLYNESRFSPVAVSHAGAAGMAQFMPNTAVEFELDPIARTDLWQRYQQIRKAERAKRRQSQKAFLQRWGISKFSTAEVIQHALEKDQLDALAEFQAMVDAPKPERTALKDYVNGVKAELAKHDFFADGGKTLGRLDARASYAAPTASVDYIARRLKENSGMTSSAIAAYNAGPAAVRDGNPRSVLYGYGDLPAYPETVKYVQRIMVVYSKLRDQLA
ncbi:MAG: transglycosylase SLT domain-containing protein [Gammaproteobacteria bacterium]